MNASPSIAALAAALTKAQSAMTGARKDSTNPHFKSSYADLASMWDACRSPLANAGLSVIQLTSSDEKSAIIETILAHASGEWVASTLAVPLSKVDAQGLGSAITYGRRYALAAIVGIAPEEDDGEAAVNRKPADKPAPRKAIPPTLAPEPDVVPMYHPEDDGRPSTRPKTKPTSSDL